MIHEIWHHILLELKQKISTMELSTWFYKVRMDVKDDMITLYVPSEMHKSWIIKKYKDVLESIITHHYEHIKGMELVVDSELSDMPSEYSDVFKEVNKPLYDSVEKPIENKITLTDGLESRMLQSRYTLSSFVVGDENKLAHAACMAVVETMDGRKKYNPLFIYGGVGLGKTHLLQGTANEILRRNSDKTVVYTTAERFFNQLIKAIRTQKTEQFRKLYRKCDVLLLDDVQFFDKKEYAQDELFNTFNDLFELQKQILFAADRPPSELTGISDRLRSRMGWGLTVDVQFPSYETRMAILYEKAKAMNMLLNHDMADFICTNVRRSLRELEAILTQIEAEMELSKTQPTIQSVAKILRKLNPQDTISSHKDAQKSIARNATDIQNYVSEHYKIPVTDITGVSRKQEYVQARQVCYMLCRDALGMSLDAIGDAFGGKNHSTILHGIKKLKESMKHNEYLKNDIERLCKDMGIAV